MQTDRVIHMHPTANLLNQDYENLALLTWPTLGEAGEKTEIAHAWCPSKVHM